MDFVNHSISKYYCILSIICIMKLILTAGVEIVYRLCLQALRSNFWQRASVWHSSWLCPHCTGEKPAIVGTALLTIIILQECVCGKQGQGRGKGVDEDKGSVSSRVWLLCLSFRFQTFAQTCQKWSGIHHWWKTGNAIALCLWCCVSGWSGVMSLWEGRKSKVKLRRCWAMP